MTSNHKKRGKIGFVLYLIMFISAGVYSANIAWQEAQLRDELSSKGVPAQAVIQECGNRGACEVAYQFEVTLPNQPIKTYSVDETYVCSGCQEGTHLAIRYLPQDPTRAGIEGRNNTTFYTFLTIVSFMMILVGIKDQMNKKSKSR